MTACRVGPSPGRLETGSIEFSYWTPNGTEPRRLTQSANRNLVENNMRRNQNKRTKLNEGKTKRNLDTSDRLIETGHFRNYKIGFVCFSSDRKFRSRMTTETSAVFLPPSLIESSSERVANTKLTPMFDERNVSTGASRPPLTVPQSALTAP
jgi:hypothetical protein